MGKALRTQVAIIGAGPAGLLLSQLLQGCGIDCLVLERCDRNRLETRVRAGVLERTTVQLMARIGADAHLRERGLEHRGIHIGYDGQEFRIDLHGLTGGAVVTVYGQTELTRDLLAVCDQRGTPLRFEAEAVAVHDVESHAPWLSFRQHGELLKLDCEFVAGCDGSHGISRAAIPQERRTAFERSYPFGWLGILADVPPCAEELIYCNHERGFALASMRSRSRSRYYIQCAADESLDNWPDERIWDELALRLGPKVDAAMTRGASIEKSIVPLRSLVCEPMRHGRLFLAGDAAHIVPPTGAKGLNLAAADVAYLAEGLTSWYREGSSRALDRYSARALERVWKAERFSWWFTTLTHRFPGMDPFARKLQLAELHYLSASTAAQTALAENYVGLPLA